MKPLAAKQKKVLYFIHDNEANFPTTDREMTGHFSISVKVMQDYIAALRKIVQRSDIAPAFLEVSVILKRFFEKSACVRGCNRKILHASLYHREVKIFNIFSNIIRTY